MAILQRLGEKSQWLSFYEYKAAGGHLSKEEQEDLKLFIEQEAYLPVVEKMWKQEPFPIPNMIILNKKNSAKKRVVFTYPREENYILKLLAYLLAEYDECMAPNLYSFRKNRSVKTAIWELSTTRNVDEMFSYKMDIHDYFNSVEIEILLPKLRDILKKEEELYLFLEELLRNPFVQKGKEIVAVKKGIMAGVPIASFLANLYLKKMDFLFAERGMLYARYSDDIITFAKTKEELEVQKRLILSTLESHGLSVNPDKCRQTNPGEAWEYLGFSYCSGVVDISDIAIQKIKQKLKRKARAIFRWKEKNQKRDEYAVRAYIKFLNRKFFDNPVQNEITWCRWYFPIIHTDKSLREIDQYAQSCIRYIVTGKYTKANYNLRYEKMKELGYRSLVNEYYKGGK